MNKKFVLLVAGLALALMSGHSLADNFVNVPNPSAVWDSTTTTLYALGIPGHGQSGQTIIPSAGTSTVWTGTETFTNSKLRLLGSSTGYTTFTSDNSGASNFTLHFPAANDTLAAIAATQTLTNKTLTAPVINNPVVAGPVPVACGATCTVGAGNDLTLLNQAAGSVATLGGATASGIVHKFRITVATTSAAEKILTNPTTDTIIGTAIGENAATAKVFVGNASTYHSIQMPFAGSQPSGGFIGDQITCTDVAIGVWACDINYQGGATPTTPYSASTT